VQIGTLYVVTISLLYRYYEVVSKSSKMLLGRSNNHSEQAANIDKYRTVSSPWKSSIALLLLTMLRLPRYPTQRQPSKAFALNGILYTLQA
jgi:hypothetical protein